MGDIELSELLKWKKIFLIDNDSTPENIREFIQYTTKSQFAQKPKEILRVIISLLKDPNHVEETKNDLLMNLQLIHIIGILMNLNYILMN